MSSLQNEDFTVAIDKVAHIQPTITGPGTVIILLLTKSVLVYFETWTGSVELVVTATVIDRFQVLSYRQNWFTFVDANGLYWA